MTLRVAAVAAYAVAVFCAGLALTWGVGVWILELDFGPGDWESLLLLGLVLAGYPALLAALPPRFGLILLGIAAVPLAVHSWSVMQEPGDGAMYGLFGMGIAILLALFSLLVIGGRTLLTRPQP